MPSECSSASLSRSEHALLSTCRAVHDKLHRSACRALGCAAPSVHGRTTWQLVPQLALSSGTALSSAHIRLQSQIMAVQQSLSLVQQSLDYTTLNIQNIQSAINTVQSQITVGSGAGQLARRSHDAGCVARPLPAIECMARASIVAALRAATWRRLEMLPAGAFAAVQADGTFG